MMKNAKILHNPGAGNARHTGEQLVAILEEQGFICRYSSTKKKGWKKLEEDTDLIIVAGGDGTVRRVTVKLMCGTEKRSIPIVVVPLGTANNIAKALGMTGDVHEILQDLSSKKRKRFDVGKISGLDEEHLFLESFGFGIFPKLMKNMHDHPPATAGAPEEELKTALKRIQDVILTLPASGFRISIDGQEISGNYILVEVMNIRSIGPNLILSPASDPGDGQYELVLVSEDEREAFAAWIQHLMTGTRSNYSPLVIKGEKINIETDAVQMHVDDEWLAGGKSTSVKVRPNGATVEFLVQ